LFPPKYTGPERRKKRRWRPRPFRVLLSLLVISVIGYVLAVIGLIQEETRRVFRAGSTLATGRPPFPYEQIELSRADGARQFAWVIRHGHTDVGPWVLYLHGNVTSVASQVNIAHYRLLRALGINVLAPEYRGFGGIDGTPTEDSLRADARAAYDYLRESRKVPPDAIAIYGWSLGSAIAVDMATRVPPAAMILEGAPASLVDLITRRYPFIPLRLLMRSSFDSIRTINRIPVPILFLHGDSDEVVPITEGRRLYDAAGGAKAFVEVRGGHVNAIELDAARFEDASREFMIRHRQLALK
jgi:fermentation-respiration switch protein FrsA (DUF1100 family)